MVAEFISMWTQSQYLQRICVGMKLLPLQGQEMKMKKIKLRLLGTRTFWWLLPPRRRIQPIQPINPINPIILSLKLLQLLRPEEAAAGLPAGESSLLGPQNEPGW
jgi:hypothetical protein